MLKDKVLEYWEQEHPDKLLDLIERGHADVVSMTYLYIDSFKEDPQAIYKHIDEIAGALEQSDFIEYCEGNTKTRLEMIEGIKEAPENSFLFMFPETEPTDPAEQEAEGALSLEDLRDLTRVHIPTAERRNILINDLTNELSRYEQNYENCYRFFSLCLSRQLDVIDKYLDGDRREYTRIVDRYITRWYKKPEPEKGAHEEGLNPAEAKAKASIRRADISEYPLDKVNNNVWNMLQKTSADGQLSFGWDLEELGAGVPFDMKPDQPDKQAYAIYSINFDELEELGDSLKISKWLAPFDKRVYIAISALFNAGNEIITLTQIHYALGYDKRPNDKQLARINEAVEKMHRAYITITNEQENKVLPNYPLYEYKGYLLPIESITATVNGKLSERAIKIYREPPLMTFAKKRKQVTTITIKLLQSPISKTDGNLAIEDYLLERISREANKGRKDMRILFSTMYERLHITKRVDKTRAPKKVSTYLEYYKCQGFIKDYEAQKDGVLIIL